MQLFWLIKEPDYGEELGTWNHQMSSNDSLMAVNHLYCLLYVNEVFE